MFARTAGSEAMMQQLGESSGTSLRIGGLPAGELEVSVVPQFGNDHFDVPERADRHRGCLPEFARTAPYAMTGLAAEQHTDGVQLSWDAGAGDVDYVEIRRGSSWSGAEVLARVEGREWIDRWTAPGARTYHVAARYAGGLYSGSIETVTVTPEPLRWAAAAAEISTGTATGTLDGTAFADSALELAAGATRGTYTHTTLIDLDHPEEMEWRVEVDRHELDHSDDWLGVELGSTESMWRRVESREPSAGMPGYGFATELADLEWSDVVGPRDGVGRNTLCEVEMRFDLTGGGDVTEWEPYRPVVRKAKSMDVRLTLHRRSTEFDLVVDRLSAQAIPTEPTPRRRYVLTDDFETYRSQWQYTKNGTANIYTTTSQYAFLQTADDAGVVRFDTGAAGDASIRIYDRGWRLGAGWAFEAIVSVTYDSPAMKIRIGWNDAAGYAQGDDGVWLEVDRAVDDNVRLVASSNGVRKSVDSKFPFPIAAKASIYVEIDDAEHALFWVNGTYLGKVLSNVPVAAGRDTGFAFQAASGSGATNVLDVGYVAIYRNMDR